MSRASLEICRRALRAAIPPLAEANPATATSQHLRSWLALYQITEKQHWLDLLRAASSTITSLSTEHRGEWLRLCCDGWVVDASGPFRAAANSLGATPLYGTSAVPGLLRNWRITGEPKFRDQALAQLPLNAAVGDFEGATALHAAYHATGEEHHKEAAMAAFEGLGPKEIPLRWWPLAWDILGWNAELVAPTIESWQEQAPAAEDILPALAPLCLPRLDLEVHWWDARELEEGYVAEAVTFPYPALSLSFIRRLGPGQVFFRPLLDGEARDILEDAGVVASLLNHLVEEVNRQSVVNPPRERLGRSAIRRG